ncbi:MAG: cellulase family glycosylhydrolase [Gaiellaceae bacterium]
MLRRRLLFLLLAAAALVLAPSGSSASRMWIGFQDDPEFRWDDGRADMILQASQVHATIIRSWVSWTEAAPVRPVNARDPFDPAYRFDDLDEMIRNAQLRGLEVLLTIWETPPWANGGKTRNWAPKRASDFGDFAYAVADRYSGRYAGYPYVRFYSIWNEPNLYQFLAPQFSGGKPVSPHLYAQLARTGYTGIKSANPGALVAIGETSPRGHDKPTPGIQDSLSPATFAQFLAQERPKLKFDAYAHHPYVPLGKSPLLKVRWPTVTFFDLKRFESSLLTWFGRKSIPLWITEYAHETKPENPQGVSYSAQAAYVKQAIGIAARDPSIQMLIWFVFRDNLTSSWKSGLLDEDGLEKPGLAVFDTAAAPLDARNTVTTVKAGLVDPLVRFYAREFAAHSVPGDVVGINYTVADGKRLITVSQQQTTLNVDATVSFRPKLRLFANHTYTIRLTANTIHGDVVTRALVLVAHR